ncbi:MAG: formylglycine-generating enzyme family protein, partial [Prosthecobacter sp.]
MRPPKPRRAVFLLSLSLTLSLSSVSWLSAQTTPPAGGEAAAAPAGTHTSSLGMKFVSVPGTTVLVAVWETRVSEWTQFLKERRYPWSFQTHFTQSPEHPVVGVNLQDAVAFCNWLTETEREGKTLTTVQSYRLPTPDEWDAAVGLARGRKKSSLTAEDRMLDDRVYPWGDMWPPPPKTANYAEGEIPGHNDGYAHTAPVGSFPPSPEGVFDLAGNVWEWTQPVEIRATPTGVLRGGSWAYFRPECLASAYQYVVPVDLRAPTIGFRVVFDDKRRTASLLAASDADRKKELDSRMQALAENRKVDTAAVEELRKKMQSKGGQTLPDTAS